MSDTSAPTQSDTTTADNPYVDEYGTHWGYCNSCSEEMELGLDCDNSECDGDGEVVPYDDDPDPEA